MHKDYPVGMRRRRTILLKLKREVKHQNPDLKVSLVDDKLRIDEHYFSWNDEIGLICGRLDGFSVLFSKYKINLQRENFTTQKNNLSSANVTHMPSVNCQPQTSTNNVGNAGHVGPSSH